MKLVLNFTPGQIRQMAMRQAGINTRAMAMKPGTRAQANRKALAKRGHQKHKKALLPDF
jgi:hypothetical protein